MNSIAKSEKNQRSLLGRRPLGASTVLTLAFVVACGAAGPPELEGGEGTEAEALAAAGPEDGLADAFATFLETFTNSNFDAQFQLGFGFHPGLSTERLGGTGPAPSGQAILNMNTGRVTATLNNLPRSGTFDLWFVKNLAGAGRSMAPETGDPTFKVGRFQGNGASRTLDISIGANVNFDLDMLVVTRGGKTPVESRIAVGDRTLFEKRLFRFRQNQGLDPVTGALADDIETTDALVARGAEIFFNETFGGNGRTCGTCHRADENLTITPAFIATLPQSDPLFVAETNPALANLENPQLLRTRGLILENVDGFDDPTHKFVMRGVPHTLALGLTNGVGNAFSGPPDHRLGWAGDGGPGRSTLHEFSFGAVIQHFTKTLQRRPGIDFRIPTQEELDALEAFQLFTGRQKPVDFFAQFPTNPRAQNGENLFLGTGCTSCHDDLFGFINGFAQNFDTGVANLTPDLIDDGFLTPGDGTFNVPPLAEAADTGPFFHNNAVATIEDAVGFYFSPTFQASPSSFFIFAQLSVEEQEDMAAFLRVVNSSTNISQVRKRVQFVQKNRSPGNTDLLTIAIADAQDARVVLAEKGLNPAVRTQLRDAETILKDAKAGADGSRPAAMKKALTLLDKAAAGLFTSTPPTGGTGGTGGSGGRGGGGTGGTVVGGSGGIPTGGAAGSAGAFTGGAPTGGAAGSSAGTGAVGGMGTGGTFPTGGTSAGGAGGRGG